MPDEEPQSDPMTEALHGRNSRGGNPVSKDMTAVRRARTEKQARQKAELEIAALRAYVDEVAALAPELTEETRRKLALLFVGCGGRAEAIKRSAACYGSDTA